VARRQPLWARMNLGVAPFPVRPRRRPGPRRRSFPCCAGGWVPCVPDRVQVRDLLVPGIDLDRTRSDPDSRPDRGGQALAANPSRLLMNSWSQPISLAGPPRVLGDWSSAPGGGDVMAASPSSAASGRAACSATLKLARVFLIHPAGPVAFGLLK